jgi:hypothetical protein
MARRIRPFDLDGHPRQKEVPSFADLWMGATLAVKGLFGCELVDEPAKRRAGATIMVGVDGEAAHRSKVSYSARSQEVWEGRGRSLNGWRTMVLSRSESRGSSSTATAWRSDLAFNEPSRWNRPSDHNFVRRRTVSISSPRQIL